MITAPTMPQLLETLRDELGSTVMPQLEDAPTKVAVEMMQAVLNQLIERAENEFAWMFGEMAAIEAAAGELGPSLGSAAVDAALAEFQANRADTMTLSAVDAPIHSASEPNKSTPRGPAPIATRKGSGLIRIPKLSQWNVIMAQ